MSGMPSAHSSAGGGVTSGTRAPVSRIPSTHSSSGGGVTKMHGTSSSMGSKTKTGGRSTLSAGGHGHGVVVV